jgi:integrase
MPRVADSKLTTNKDGSFSARKRIPADVQDAYAKLYGNRWEDRFNSGPGVTAVLARAKHREWLSEIEARIENIRAERRGDGRMLTPMEARALAGEWYKWFTARHSAKPKSAEYWCYERSELCFDVHDEVWAATGLEWDPEKDPLELWEENEKARTRVRPLIADRAKAAQFLSTKQLTLDGPARDMFLDHVCGDLFAALELLLRQARGDYSPDKHAEQFPGFERTTDPALTPWMLFQRWIADAKPADATVDRWRSVFLELQEAFHGCGEITAEAAQEWARGLIGTDRSARTVSDVWVVASRTVFGWAKSQRLVGQNPFTEVRIKVPRKTTTRDNGKGFDPEEIKTILRGSLAITQPRTKMEAAKRWLPWLCAYTGARSGEIAQLRGVDYVEQEVQAIKITPAAGTVKTKQARLVPLHEHLIEQGFPEFVKASGKGPLFYSEQKTAPAASDATNPPKKRYVKVRERIAGWVRELGVTDPDVQPNHAWRHTFKQVCDRHGISERVSDAITGHAALTVGRGYGAPSLQDKAAGLRRFPRYQVEEQTPDAVGSGAAR